MEDHRADAVKTIIHVLRLVPMAITGNDQMTILVNPIAKPRQKSLTNCFGKRLGLSDIPMECGFAVDLVDVLPTRTAGPVEPEFEFIARDVDVWVDLHDGYPRSGEKCV